MTLGSCKLKQWNTTAYRLKWLKSKTLTIPNADQDEEQQESSFITGEDVKCNFALPFAHHFGSHFGSFLQSST